MSCLICGRGSCMPSFHSIEEQEAYEKAMEAYEAFFKVREKCRREWEESGDDPNG